jgi:hypothetical protein
VSSAITSRPASRACWTAGDDGRGVGGCQQDALGAIGDAGLDCGNLGLVVAVDLAGIGLQRHAEFRGLGFSAFLHLDEEWICVSLGDQAGADTVAGGLSRSRGQCAECGSGEQRGLECGSGLHVILPGF